MPTHSCPLCDRKLANVGGVQAHLSDKHPACPTCREHFANDYKLKKHRLAEEHCYCKQHDVWFTANELHQEHKRNVLHLMELACVACETNFPSQTALDEHRQGHGHAAVRIAIERRDVLVTIPTDEEHHNLRCDECDLDFSTLFILRGHKSKVKHDVSRHLICPFSDECDGPFSSTSLLLAHLESGVCQSGMDCSKLDALLREHGPDEHIALAENLDMTTTIATELAKTQTKDKITNIAQHQCHCGLHFQNFARLLTHIRITNHMAICSCFLTFPTNVDFLSHQKASGHLRNIGSTAAVNPHAVACRCGLRVRDRRCLEVHHRATAHEGTEITKSPSFCAVCERLMANSKHGTLDKHTAEKHPACATCGQVFQYEVDLKVHQIEAGDGHCQMQSSQLLTEDVKDTGNLATKTQASRDVFDISGASTIFEENVPESSETSSIEAPSTSTTPPTSSASSITELEAFDEEVANRLDVVRGRTRSDSLCTDDSDGGVFLPIGYSETAITTHTVQTAENSAVVRSRISTPPSRVTTSKERSFKLPSLLKRLQLAKPLAPQRSFMGCGPEIPF